MKKLLISTLVAGACHIGVAVAQDSDVNLASNQPLLFDVDANGEAANSVTVNDNLTDLFKEVIGDDDNNSNVVVSPKKDVVKSDVVINVKPVKKAQPSQNRPKAFVNIVGRTSVEEKAASEETPVAVPVVTINNPIKASQSFEGYNPVGFSLNPVFGLNKTQNGGLLTFNIPTDDTVVDVKQSGNRIIAEFQGYQLPSSEQRRLDVSDYGTPIEYIDIKRTSKGTRLELSMGKNSFAYLSVKKHGTFSIEVKKPAKSAVELEADERLGFNNSRIYTGAPVTFNFQDIAVRQALFLIGDFTKKNILISDSVTGNITLRLDDIPWDQALDIILKTKGLDKRENGNVIYIAPQKDLSGAELAALESAQKRRNLLPTRTEIIEINYANASEIKSLIESAGKASDKDVAREAVLSARGNITVDARTNTLIVNDIPDRIEAVRDMVRRLDKPVKQVLIDGRIATISSDFGRSLGLNWGFGFNKKIGGYTIGNAGSGEGADSIAEKGLFDAKTGAPSADLGQRLGIKLGGKGDDNSALGYGVSILGADFLVDLELAAAQAEGQGEVLASPRVIAQNNTAANIVSGDTVSLVVDKSLQTINANLSINVTPRITPEDMIDMKLTISDDKINPKGAAGGTTVTRNSVNTNVLVDNGETVVLGGIFKQNKSSGEKKVPLLGDIPVVGNLFKSKSRNLAKSETLFFVTPRILDGKLVERDKFSNLRN